MNLEGVHLVCKEHLPPVLRLFLDPSYKYSQHKHTSETSSDGIHHTYTLVLTQEPVSKSDDSIHLKMDNTTSDLMSQISSTTTSEKSRLGQSPIVMNSLPLTQKEKKTGDNQYFLLSMTADGPKVVPSELPEKKKEEGKSEQSCSVVDGYSYLNIPEDSQSSIGVQNTTTGKYVTMVHVKFILLHRDALKRRGQSNFSDEFQSDTLLEDVVQNFRELCDRQNFPLHGRKFEPRFSYCVGEASMENSKPVEKSDLVKSLAQLAPSKTIHQFTLIADNIGDK